MTCPKRCKQTLVLATLMLSLGSPGIGAGGVADRGGDNAPLRMVPADALFCVLVNQFSTTLSQVDQFLTGISPVGVSMPVQAQLGRFLGQPEPAGINMAGDVAVFWPLPGGEKPEPRRVGILIPLSNFQQFLTNPNVTQPNEQGIVRIGPEGKPSVAAVQVGNYLLVTPIASEQALTEAKTWTGTGGTSSLAQRLNSSELKRATSSPVWTYANIQIANKMFGAKLQEKIQQAQKRLQTLPKTAQPVPVPPQGAIEIWTTMLNAFLQQTQFVSLTLDPSATVLRLAPELAAMPDTEMAKLLSLSGRPESQANLTGYMEDGAITTGVANLSPELVRALTLKRVDLTMALLGPTMSKDDLEQLRKLATDSAEALGGGAAWAFLPEIKNKPPFSLRYVATVRNKQKLSEVLDQAGKLMKGDTLANLGKKFGIKMEFNLQRNAETYKDVPIDAMTILLQPLDANTPQGQMLQKVYGGDLRIRMAVVNDLLLYVLSADPQSGIHTLIDQAKAGGPGQAPSEIQAALQLLPNAKGAAFFGTYNYVRALQMALAFLPPPMAVPQVEVTSQSNAAFSGDIGNAKLLIDAAIPKQQVLEVMSIIIRLQQQKMLEQQKQQQQQGPATVQPNPPERL